MKYKVDRSILNQYDCNCNAKKMKKTELSKKHTLRKLLVVTVSWCFVSFNSAMSYAQMTGGSTDMDGTSMETMDDETDAMQDATETMEVPPSETPEADDTTSVVDLVEGTTSEPADVPAEQANGSGGGGGGAILALVAAGAIAVVVISNNKKKKPKIQKTFISDQVAGVGTQLIDISTQSNFLDQPKSSLFGLQYGTYQSVSSLNQPYSFLNINYQKRLGSKLNVFADAGTRYFVKAASELQDSQWLNLGFATTSMLAKNDRLSFTAKYAVGDIDKNNDSFELQSTALQNYGAIFSDQNSEFELAYSRALGQNHRLGFLMQKLSSDIEDYAAKLAWRYTF